MWQKKREVGAAYAVEIELRLLQGAQQRALCWAEVEALELMAVDFLGASQPAKVAAASREIIELAEVFKVTAIASEQDLAQIAVTIN